MQKGKFFQGASRLLPRILAPLIVLAISLGVSFAFTGSSTKVFQASGRIWCQTRGIAIQTAGGSGGGQYLNSPLTSGQNPLQTACEVIKSEAVMIMAHDFIANKVGAQACPSVGAIMGGTVAQPVKDTDVLRISYVCDDAKVALAVVDGVIEAFFKENNISMSGTATKSKYYLEKQLKQARANYEKTRENVRKFKESNKTVDLDTQMQGLLSLKSSLAKEVSETKQTADSQRSKLAYLEKSMGFKAANVMTVDSLSKDELLKGLRNTIAENEVKIVDLRSKYQEEHPKMKRLRASTAEAKQAIADRLKSIIGADDPTLAADNVTNGSNVRTKMLDEMVQVQAEEVAADERAISLNGLLQKVESQLNQIPRQQLTLAELQRADEVAAHSLSEVEKEVQSITITESVAMGTSNLQVIDHPVVEDQTPNNQKIGIFISFVLALITCVLQYLADPRIRNAKQIATLLPLQIVGWVPTFKEGTQITHLLAPLQKLRGQIKSWSEAGEKIILFTSGDLQDGKSTVAYGAALSLIEQGQKVLLIDANLEHPYLHIFAKEQASPGLADYLEYPSEETLRDCTRFVKNNFHLIPAGKIVPGADALRMPDFTDLLKVVADKFDVVIIDGHAAGKSVNSLSLPDVSLHVVSVVRLGHTMRQSLKILAAQLTMLPVLESVVLVNDADERLIASAVLSPTMGASQTLQPADIRGGVTDVRSGGANSSESQTALW